MSPRLFIWTHRPRPSEVEHYARIVDTGDVVDATAREERDRCRPVWQCGPVRELWTIARIAAERVEILWATESCRSAPRLPDTADIQRAWAPGREVEALEICQAARRALILAHAEDPEAPHTPGDAIHRFAAIVSAATGEMGEALEDTASGRIYLPAPDRTRALYYRPLDRAYSIVDWPRP